MICFYNFNAFYRKIFECNENIPPFFFYLSDAMPSNWHHFIHSLFTQLLPHRRAAFLRSQPCKIFSLLFNSKLIFLFSHFQNGQSDNGTNAGVCSEGEEHQNQSTECQKSAGCNRTSRTREFGAGEEKQMIPKNGISPSHFQSRNAERREKCMMCLGKVSSITRVTMGCVHEFHRRCLYRWLKYNTSCPVCRFNFSRALPPEAPDDQWRGEVSFRNFPLAKIKNSQIFRSPTNRSRNWSGPEDEPKKPCCPRLHDQCIHKFCCCIMFKCLGVVISRPVYCIPICSFLIFLYSYMYCILSLCMYMLIEQCSK